MPPPFPNLISSRAFSYHIEMQILKINPEKKNIDSFEASDFKLIGYDPHEKIEMKMAVQSSILGSVYSEAPVQFQAASAHFEVNL